jgi:hypothetical protein
VIAPANGFRVGPGRIARVRDPRPAAARDEQR